MVWAVMVMDSLPWTAYLGQGSTRARSSNPAGRYRADSVSENWTFCAWHIVHRHAR